MSRLPISHKVSTIAAARPEIQEVRFIYNFFLPDEAGNDMSGERDANGHRTVTGYKMSNAAADAFEKQKSFSVDHPRFNAISVNPGQILGATPTAEISALLKDNNLDDFLMKDIDLNFPNYIGTRIGDGELVGRITKLASHLHKIKTGEDTEDPSRIATTTNRLFSDNTRRKVIQDCFVAVDPITPTSNDGSEDIVAPHASMKSVNFLTPLPSESPFLKSAGFSVDLKISTSHYDDAMSFASNFPSTPLTQFVLTNFNKIKSISRNAPNIEDRYGDTYRSDEEDSLIPLTFEKVDEHQRPEYVNAGMIMQKYEVTHDHLQLQ